MNCRALFEPRPSLRDIAFGDSGLAQTLDRTRRRYAPQRLLTAPNNTASKFAGNNIWRSEKPLRSVATPGSSEQWRRQGGEADAVDATQKTSNECLVFIGAHNYQISLLTFVIIFCFRFHAAVNIETCGAHIPTNGRRRRTSQRPPSAIDENRHRRDVGALLDLIWYRRNICRRRRSFEYVMLVGNKIFRLAISLRNIRRDFTLEIFDNFGFRLNNMYMSIAMLIDFFYRFLVGIFYASSAGGAVITSTFEMMHFSMIRAASGGIKRANPSIRHC